MPSYSPLFQDTSLPDGRILNIGSKPLHLFEVAGIGAFCSSEACMRPLASVYLLQYCWCIMNLMNHEPYSPENAQELTMNTPSVNSQAYLHSFQCIINSV